MSVDNLVQVGILFTGCTGILLFAIPDSWAKWKKWKRWAPVLGLVSQPLWFYLAGHQDGLWGLSYLNIAYTLSWGYGVWLNWGVPLREKRSSKGQLKNVNA